MNSLRASKRRRMSEEPKVAITPPPICDGELTAGSEAKASVEAADGEAQDFLLARATHVLVTEAAALANIATLYQTNKTARIGLSSAVHAITNAHSTGGKLIAIGVGKSAYIAQKLVATCKSLSIRASFMHACEALHGDLGDVCENDVILFISFSGRTPELLNLLPHIPRCARILALTGQTRAEDCRILDNLGDGILLPAPIPESEEVTFGVAAPTTSTTVALAVADMLALTVADQLHRSRTGEVFKRNHPGGAIGIASRENERRKRPRLDGLVTLELPSPPLSGSDDG